MNNGSVCPRKKKCMFIYCNTSLFTVKYWLRKCAFRLLNIGMWYRKLYSLIKWHWETKLDGKGRWIRCKVEADNVQSASLHMNKSLASTHTHTVMVMDISTCSNVLAKDKAVMNLSQSSLLYHSNLLFFAPSHFSSSQPCGHEQWVVMFYA